MECRKSHGSTFFVDDVTKVLSKKYDVNSYKGPFNTLGDCHMEGAMGKFMFLAKLCGEFVGTDINTYMKKFDTEQWYDSADQVYDESDLEAYAKLTEEEIKSKPIRIEIENGKKIYFPTEDLIKIMCEGTGFVPIDTFQEFHRKRN